jgi:RimJ/RimL family protein N-acetyltransferase
MKIETERLLLRPLTLADVDELVAIHADPEVGRHMSAFDRERAIERLIADRNDWDTYGSGLIAVEDRRTRRFLGRAALKFWPRFEETELGWVLRRDAWGHGYATEAAGACGDWGFANLDIPYLTAMIRPANTRSIAVAERLGMTPLRHDHLQGIPVAVYWITREEWGARPALTNRK